MAEVLESVIAETNRPQVWNMVEFDFDDARLDWPEDAPRDEWPQSKLAYRALSTEDEIACSVYGKPIARVGLHWVEASVSAQETVVEKATTQIQSWLAEIACSDVTFTRVGLRSIGLSEGIDQYNNVLKDVIPKDVTIEALAVVARLRAEATG